MIPVSVQVGEKRRRGQRDHLPDPDGGRRHPQRPGQKQDRPLRGVPQEVRKGTDLNDRFLACL